MTARRDPDPAISAWLNDEAAERAPEHLLSTTRTRIESTNQRRAWWPAWRLQSMNNRILGGAVAAIAVIVVLGFVLIPRPTGTGGVTPTPVPSPSPSLAPSPPPSAAASPSAAPSLAVIPPGQLCSASGNCLTGTLEAGTYSFDAGGVTPAKLTFTVPEGWNTDQGFVRKNFDLNAPTAVEDSPTEVVFATFPVDHIYTDACHWLATMVSAGTTVDQLTNLLVAQKGRVASVPTTVTIGGFPAKRVQLTVPTSIDMTKCDNELLHFWPDVGGNGSGGLCCAAAGTTDVADVVNVAGQRFVVVARHAAGASSADLAELNAIIASIKIAAPPASPAPSGASPSP
jgi:hypothetical protein